MEMGFVGHFGQALPVWVVWELFESVQIPPVLGTCFLIRCTNTKNRWEAARILSLWFDLECNRCCEHNREDHTLELLL